MAAIRRPKAALAAAAPASPAAASRAAASSERQLTLFDRLDSLVRRDGDRDPTRPALALLHVVLAAMVVGLLVQASHAATTLPPDVFRQQLVGSFGIRILGLAVLWGASHLGPEGVRRFLPYAFVGAIILLILVYVPGVGATINGARRWVRIGPVQFQPSELARIVLILWLANHCVLLGSRMSDFRRAVVPLLAWSMVYFALIYFEKDLGGSLLLITCALGTMWVGGARSGHVGPLLTWGVLGAIGLGVALSAHVQRRILTWLGILPNNQISGTTGAVESGGLLGLGHTQGVARIQSVPHLESDFVLAQIGEELGLVGMFVVVALFLAFAWYALQLVLELRGGFGALASFGLLLSIALQAVIHVEGTAGMGPAKGVTLPFISHGGSSMVVSCLAVGLALGAARGRARGGPPEGARA